MDSIIFDLDGTLWDATKKMAKPWEETLRKYGVKRSITAEDMGSVMGMTVSQIAEKFMPQKEEEERVKIAYECCNAETPYLKKYGGELYPELEETLKKLSEKYKLFIVSNCETDYLNAFFEFHNLKKYFTDVEYIGRTGKEKCENIKIIVERNKLINPVYVGDTNMDFEASSKAGVPFIFASYGFGKSEKYIAKLEKISDLPDLMEKL